MSERATSPAVFDRILTLCGEAGFAPNIVSTATVSSGVIALVEAGDGIAIVPEGSRFLGPGDVHFVPLQGAATTVDLVIAWPSLRISGAHRSFLTLARKFRADNIVNSA